MRALRGYQDPGIVERTESSVSEGPPLAGGLHGVGVVVQGGDLRNGGVTSQEHLHKGAGGRAIDGSRTRSGGGAGRGHREPIVGLSLGQV